MHRSYVNDDGVRWVKQIIPGAERIPTRVHIPYKISVAKDSPIIPGLGSSSDEYSDEDVRMENNGVVKGTKPGHVPPKYAKNSPDVAAGRGKNESTRKRSRLKDVKVMRPAIKERRVLNPLTLAMAKAIVIHVTIHVTVICLASVITETMAEGDMTIAIVIM